VRHIHRFCCLGATQPGHRFVWPEVLAHRWLGWLLVSKG
jgi:hypothetical protein